MFGSSAASRLRKRASAEGAIWKNHPYFDQAEDSLLPQWTGLIWPMIEDCDFTSVVDLAAGHGRNSEQLRHVAGQITIVDVNRENIDFCKVRFAGDAKFSFVTNDGCRLRGIGNESVSMIYCFDAMVHFDSDVVRAYLAEFRRVLKPGGRGFCHHSNYTGNPAGDFLNDPNWRNFMSQELFHHCCAKEGLAVVRSRVVDWTGAPGHDCVTVFEKPVRPTDAKKFAAASVGSSNSLRRKHLRVEVLSPASGNDASSERFCAVSNDSFSVYPAAKRTETPTVVSLDTASWQVSGQEIAEVGVESAIAGGGAGDRLVIRLELHAGERGAGALVAHSECEVCRDHGWVKLQAGVPRGSAARSILLTVRADGRPTNGLSATFKDVRVESRSALAA
jgi:SAM-dependent methyltransferase